MTHDYKYEQMFQEGKLSEEDRNGLIPVIRRILRVPEISDEEMKRVQQHCQCRSGSPDTCPKCTEMETGEKFVDQEHTCIDCKGSGLDKDHQWPDGSFASCETCEGYGTLSEIKNL